MNYYMLGKRIRNSRKEHKLTQETLAAKVGISSSFLGHVERGSRKASLETLVEIANALCISTDFLLSDSLAEALGSCQSPKQTVLSYIDEIKQFIIDNIADDDESLT